MKCDQRRILRRGYVTLLASVAAMWLSAATSYADVTTPLKITSCVLNQDGTTAVQWQGGDTNIVIQFTAGRRFPARRGRERCGDRAHSAQDHFPDADGLARPEVG